MNEIILSSAAYAFSGCLSLRKRRRHPVPGRQTRKRAANQGLANLSIWTGRGALPPVPWPHLADLGKAAMKFVCRSGRQVAAIHLQESGNRFSNLSELLGGRCIRGEYPFFKFSNRCIHARGARFFDRLSQRCREFRELNHYRAALVAQRCAQPGGYASAAATLAFAAPASAPALRAACAPAPVARARARDREPQAAAPRARCRKAPLR